jgi:hypothetical protein
VRADGLQPRPHRQLPHLRLPGCAPPDAAVRVRLEGPSGDELHRRRRPHDPRRAEGRAGPAHLHHAVRGRVSRGRGGSRPADAGRDAAGDRRGQPRGDGQPRARARAQRPHLSQRRVDLLPHRQLSRLRRAGAARPGGDQARRPRRQRQLRQRRRPRLRAVEGDQARGTDMGLRPRARASRLAPRVLGDGAAAARRAPDRPARRRHRPDLPAPRERDRAERGRHLQALRPVLGPRRAPDHRQREDVEVARQRLQRPGRRQPGFPACRATIASSSASPGTRCTRQTRRCGGWPTS